MILTDLKGTLVLSFIAAMSATAGTVADATIGVDTPISLGSALTCASVVVGGSWWIGRKFKAQDIMHKANKRRFDRIEKTQQLICKRLGININFSDSIELEDTTEEDEAL